jgi:PAS domain S-box-containing protein
MLEVMEPSGGGQPSSPAGERAPFTGDVVLAEERYRAIVEHLPKSVVVLCDTELRLVLVDGPDAEATGFSKATMEGKTIHEALPPDFAAQVEPSIRRVLSGESFFAEIRFGDRSYEYDYVPIRGESGRVVYGLIVGMNVTERHRAIEALRTTEKRFARIFHDSPDAIGVSRERDGMLFEVNAAFETILGYSREEAIGRTTIELGLWVEPGHRVEAVALLAATGRAELEYPIRRKDGFVLDGQLNVSVVELQGERCILFVFRDLSDKTRALRALEASEARYRALGEATFEGIALTDAGRVVEANEQLARMLGIPCKAMVGMRTSDFVAPESREAVAARMKHESEEPYEHLALRHDGTIFPVEVRARRVLVGGRSYRVTVIRDITQRRRAEAERERLIGELRARNSEMEQFAYTVSHDLKSPLVTINGFLGMLQRDLAEGNMESTGADMERIGSAATKMMRLLNDLLELSRVGRVTSPWHEVSLGEIVQESLELLSGAIRARKVEVVVSGVLPSVVGDRLRLGQVVQNLVENAVKYMGDQPEPLIEIGTRLDPTRHICFVRDNGIGIEPAHAERVFGLFEKLDPKSDGTGVGLALARRILEYHGGGIRLESDGVGSTFVFHLPKAALITHEREAT